jgi:Tol biopolymer transport system component/predicted Ser/Thr protein kinase
LSLTAGTRLGAYEILGPLGAGGMGEVYRATDVRVDRAVALKLLPEEFFESEERRQRFEREARMLASLNHPGVAVLYSFEEIPSSSPSSSSRHILVMELVAGQTLRERMKAGGLSARETLDIGAQITRGLAAAHEKGIVHRDLKPENVVLSKDGRVKILDFGLAKLAPRQQPGGDLTSAGTRSLLTEAGAVFGTVAYMSPEQVSGEPVDARSDIFSFGTILYELLAGTNPFRAETSAETMTAILRHDPPPLSEPPLGVAPGLARIVARCLEKKRERRFQSADDLAFALETSPGSGRAQGPVGMDGARGGRRLRALAGACAAGLAIGAAAALLLERPWFIAAARPIRFTIPPPENGSFYFQYEATSFAVSPDGSQLAFVASNANGERRVWLRALSGFEARPLGGTEGASSVFWSPDGLSIGFFAGTKLKRLDLPEGPPVSVCDSSGGGGKSGTWGRGGEILYAAVQGDAIYRVAASGGTSVAIVKPNAAAGETRVVWPWFLPDGEAFLFYARVADGGRVMLAEPGRPPRVVLSAASMVQYSDPGFLVFVKEGSLLAQRFHARTGKLSGVPFPIAEHARYFMSTGAGAFSTSRGGTLAFQPQDDVHRLVWFDRSGREAGTIGAPAKVNSVRISQGGRPILFDRAVSDLGTFDVWSYDAERNVETRVTSSPDSEFSPIWLPDGKSVLFSAVRGSNPRLVRRDVATGREEELLPAGGFQVAGDVSPDGRTLVYFERTAKGSFDLWEVSLERGATPRRLLEGTLGGTVASAVARFSPDGRYLAFISSESGQREAYLMPFPGPGEKVRVSAEGASVVRWSPDGRELFFQARDRRLMSVPVRTSPSLQLGIPKSLFQIKGRSDWLAFEVSGDGTRFLAIVPEALADERPLSVVVNWPAEVPK